MAEEVWLEDIVDTLVEYESEILSCKDNLRLAFEENFGTDNPSISAQDGKKLVYDILFLEGLEDEEALEVTNAIIQLMRGGNEVVSHLRTSEVSKELLQFLQTILIEHQLSVSRKYIHQQFGEDYWTSVDSNVSIRPDGNGILIEYEIIKSYDEKTTFTSTPDAALTLINYLLAEQIDVAQSFEMVPDVLDEQEIDELIESAQELKEVVSDEKSE